MYYPSRTVYYRPQAAEKLVIKGLCTSAFGRVRKGLMSHKKLQQTAMEGLVRLLKKELQVVSVFLASQAPRDPRALMEFSWGGLYREFQKTCPHLLTFLMRTLPRHKRDAQQLFVVLLVAILAKARNNHAHLVQLVISMILMYGHSSAQVWVYCNVFTSSNRIAISIKYYLKNSVFCKQYHACTYILLIHTYA